MSVCFAASHHICVFYSRSLYRSSQNLSFLIANFRFTLIRAFQHILTNYRKVDIGPVWLLSPQMRFVENLSKQLRFHIT